MRSERAVTLSIVVAALGYFVDIYDLLLFSIIRVKSLMALGVPEADLLGSGVLLLNMQMGGLLVGGMLWGIMGDKRGRLSVLFGSITLYSIANIANGFVNSVEAYAVMRFIAGVGLAGELGAGITLVTEVMPTHSRGYGTTTVAALGFLGAVVAAVVGDYFDWRTAYFIGGAMGLGLLILRIGVYESGLFENLKATAVRRGDFLSLFRDAARMRKYVAVILVAVPIWYVIGILITFAPEFGRAMNMSEIPNAGRAVMLTYIGLSVGGLFGGWLCQRLGSRKQVVRLFLVLTSVFVALYFAPGERSLTAFYAIAFALGVSTGYWAIFVTVAAEQFGTNIRATATTTAPNFVRGSVVPLTSAFQLGRAYLGTQQSAIVVGVITLVIAFIALGGLEETFHKDLDYLES